MESMLDMFGLLIFVMLGGTAAYSIYTYVRLRRYWGFFPNKFLLPANCKPEDCLDEDGYLEYMAPKLLIFGLLCILCAVVYVPVMLPNIALLMGMEEGTTFYTVYCSIVPFLGFGAFVWYMVCQTKASKRFWD